MQRALVIGRCRHAAVSQRMTAATGRSRLGWLCRGVGCTGTLALSVAVAACGGSSPAAPTPAAVTPVAGDWRWNVRLTSITGGDCASGVFQPSVGITYAQALRLQQDGSTVTGQSNATIYGVNCEFAGTVAGSSLALRSTSCAPLIVGTIPLPVTCASGVTRLLHSVAATANLVISGNSGSGTYTETFPVSSEDGQQFDPLTVNGTVTMVRTDR